MKHLIIFIAIFMLNISVFQATHLRGLWIWNTSTVIASSTEVNKIINQCIADEVTDIYMYAYGNLTGINKINMQNFVSKAKCNNINVWAMDGYRGYFADWYGRTQFIDFINTVIAYNNSSSVDQQFIGIQGDNEPQDGQGEPKSSFHNGIKGSLLSTTGGGVWKTTAALDREYLMRDWISMTEEAYDSCQANGLRYGQAMVSWLDDYYGEPIYCTYNGQYKPVMEHIMLYLDDYFIMSYNTNPTNVFNRVQGELDYAETLNSLDRPRMWLACETHCGVGLNVSYCDTPGKNNKAAVYDDITTIETLVSSYTSYVGFNIHDWEGWEALSLPSIDTSDPGCDTPNSVKLNLDNKKIKIYPNPSKGQVTVINDNERATIKIFNLLGEIVYSRVINETTHIINLTDPSGVYLVKIQTESTIYSSKIIIE